MIRNQINPAILDLADKVADDLSDAFHREAVAPMLQVIEETNIPLTELRNSLDQIFARMDPARLERRLEAAILQATVIGIIEMEPAKIPTEGGTEDPLEEEPEPEPVGDPGGNPGGKETE
jgi:hypothetical protein